MLAVVGTGAGIAAARAVAEKAASRISWEGMQRRHDIAAALPPAAGPRAGATPEPVSEQAWTGGGFSGRTAPQAPRKPAGRTETSPNGRAGS
ncbi:MAG: hypothetical protein ABSB75_00590 [Candidatus Limnocylindrales bacterium]